MVNAQEWLDRKYPKEGWNYEHNKGKKRSEVKEIYLNEPSLEGELNLEDFTSYWKIKVYISSQVDETKLTFKNLSEGGKIIKCAEAQKWLDENYPQDGTCLRRKENKYDFNNFGKTRSEIKKLIISGYFADIKLEGHLNLNGFSNLKVLDCRGNKLTGLDLTNCDQLEGIYCSDNQLTNLSLLENCSNLTKLCCETNQLTNLDFLSVLNPEKLKELWIRDNNFSSYDLSIFSSFSNLKYLWIGNPGNLDEKKIKQNIYNRFSGSLEPLEHLTKLWNLDISNTDINEIDIDKLPRSLGGIEYSTNKRQDCKLTEIVPQLDKYFGKHGRCLKCYQLNTSNHWCQSCAEKELEGLEGQELVKKFIQNQPVNEWRITENLKWIPYEQFANIEQIGEGGFSKIYRAWWVEGPIMWDYENGEWERESWKMIALKSLNDSQNITLEFLREIANTKLVANSSFNTSVVDCYGISQDPITKNYVMVMDYKKEGNLRQLLQNKNRELSLKDKLKRLRNIAGGLSLIHNQNLIHRDFHSGNILSGYSKYDENQSHISDLGLSCSANCQKLEGQVFGVLPYVAPEVLQGQPYTPASDIYSFGIVAYELLANSYPYLEIDDMDLALKVCQDYRPDVDKVPLPQQLKDLIKRCWDADPKKRPSAEELGTVNKGIIDGWYNEIVGKESSPFFQEYQALEQEYKFFSQNPYQIHPSITTASKMIDTKQITQLLEKLKTVEEYHTKALEELTLDNFNLDELTFQENPQEKSSHQAQIEISPKSNN